VIVFTFVLVLSDDHVGASCMFGNEKKGLWCICSRKNTPFVFLWLIYPHH